MNIDKLTVGQVKEIAALAGGIASKPASTIVYPVGEWVLVRSRDSGVWFAQLTAYDPATRHAMLGDARRLWSWEGAFTLSTVALDGVKSARMPSPVPVVFVADVAELLPCSVIAIHNLTNISVYVP